MDELLQWMRENRVYHCQIEGMVLTIELPQGAHGTESASDLSEVVMYLSLIHI